MAENNSFDLLSEGRQPFSVEAEQSVIGSIIIDPKALNRAATMLKAEYFYIPQHQEIYNTLTEMYEKNLEYFKELSLSNKLKSLFNISLSIPFILNFSSTQISNINHITFF